MKTNHIPFRFAALVLALVLTVTSCSREEDPQTGPLEETATIVFRTKAATKAPDDPDDAITKFRILVFRYDGNKYLAYNQPYDLTSTNSVTLNLKTGTYDFVFVANEQEDSRLADILSTYSTAKKMADIEAEYFGSTAFEAARNIPMGGIVKNVKVIGNNKLNVNGTPIQNAWDISQYLIRLGVRVDFTLKSENQFLGNAFQGIEISRVPDKVFLLPATYSGAVNYNSAAYEASPRTIANTAFDAGSGYDPATYTWTWTKDRLILPSSVFTPKATAANAMLFSATMTGMSPLTATLGCNEPTDYTLPRNSRLTLVGTLQDRIDFTVSVMDWNTQQNVDLK